MHIYSIGYDYYAYSQNKSAKKQTKSKMNCGSNLPFGLNKKDDAAMRFASYMAHNAEGREFMAKLLPTGCVLGKIVVETTDSLGQVSKAELELDEPIQCIDPKGSNSGVEGHSSESILNIFQILPNKYKS